MATFVPTRFLVLAALRNIILCDCARWFGWGKSNGGWGQSSRNKPFHGVNFGAKLVAQKQLCQEQGHESLGRFSTAQQCALAVWGLGLTHFSYGTSGLFEIETCIPASNNCRTGWHYNEHYDHFTVDLSGSSEPAWEYQMVMLSAAVYVNADPGEGWKIAAYSPEGATKQMAIYQKNGECVLSFAGTDDLIDAEMDADAFWTEGCGYEFHRGFHADVVTELKSKHWQETFVPVLNGPVCNGSATVVGHSLGAAMAAVLAVCANSPGGLSSIGVRTMDLNVKGLYTIGEPEISTVSARNGRAENGCFPGSRIYNADTMEHDPVPRSARDAGFVHPQVNAVRQKEWMEWGKHYWERSVTVCGEHSEWSDVDRIPHKGTSGVPNVDLHASSVKYTYEAARIHR